MDSTTATIFRPEAIRRHATAEELAGAAQPTVPFVHLACYLMLALIVVAGTATWLVHIPITTSAAAVAIRRSSSGETDAPPALAILLPAAARDRLRAGQRVLVDSGGGGQAVDARVL